jgi:hypothetical protein
MTRVGDAYEGSGASAVVSTSAESDPVMEKRFMVHELYHALYFTDPAFSRTVAGIHAAIDPGVKAYVEEFFDYKDLDIRDADLMVNEFAAYFLQQPVEDAAEYFGMTVARFLEEDRGGDGSYLARGTRLLEGFSALAADYDASVFRLYGFRAGRAWK